MSVLASQTTSLMTVYSSVYSDQRKHQSSALLAFVRGIHRWIPHTKGQSVTWQMSPLSDVIMKVKDGVHFVRTKLLYQLSWSFTCFIQYSVILECFMEYSVVLEQDINHVAQCPELSSWLNRTGMIHDIWYMIWYDIWYDMICDMIYDIRYDMRDIWYDTIYDMIWYDMIWYDMIWYDMIWYDMIWYDMIYDMHSLIGAFWCWAENSQREQG